jgi:photosystem II stability/assembly factor-like uncharacterized protein
MKFVSVFLIFAGGVIMGPCSRFLSAVAVVCLVPCLLAFNSCGGSSNSTPPVTLVITWATPAAITYGTALSATQLNATANVPGTFVYTPQAGTMLTAGAQTLSVTFTPADTHTYSTTSKSVTLQVNRANPAVTWPSPAPVAVGASLSSTQLDATVKGVDGNTLAGTAVYTPSSGTVLSTPGAVNLSLTFTPTDSTDYTTATTSSTLWVRAPLTNTAYNWKPVKIIDGGDMPSIVTHPSKQGLMYIRANIGGAYRWDSATKLWVPITDWITSADSSLSGVESIAVDPTDANRVYLVAGMYLHWSPINAAILVSSDQGNTFQRVNLPFMMGGNDSGQQTGERLVVNPFNPLQLYLATHLNGLWQSLDHGATWNQVTNFPTTPTTDEVGLSFVRFDPQHSGTVYVGAYAAGIYRTTDGGTTWGLIPGQPATLPDGEAARPMRSALGPDGLFYVTYANKSNLPDINAGALYKFNPSDGSWTNITPADPQGITGYGYVGLATDPQHSNTVMVASWNRSWNPGDTIFRSTDGGTTWTSIADYSVRDGSLSPYVYAGGTIAPFGNWISSIEIDPFDSNHALYITGSTVWATDDLTNADSKNTVHWTIGADGIEETAILTLASPPTGVHLLSGMGDVCGYRHDDFSVSQPPFLNPWMQTVASLDFVESNPSFIVRAGLLDYNLHAAGAYSQDQGTTWTQFASNPPGSSALPNSLYSTTIAVSADGNTLVWAPSTASPAYSRDRGTTWTVSTGAPSNLWIAADRVNPNKFYGFNGATGTVYVSTDGGATFASATTGLPIDAGSAITNEARPRAVPGREGDLWLPLSSGLYHSTNSGASFTKIGSMDGTQLVGFGAAASGAAYPALYVVGTVGNVYGFFRSDDAGITWTHINDDNHQYSMISVITGDPRIYGRVYLGTSGRGILYGDIAP